MKISKRSRGSMDRAFDYGSKGWGFESLRDRFFLLKRGDLEKLKKSVFIKIRIMQLMFLENLRKKYYH